MRFTTFDQVKGFFDSHINLEKNTDSKASFNHRVYRLDKMNEIMNFLGNPQNSYIIIHIAGSKGKGSTSAFIANSINALGYKTGLFMSPHVSDIRERFTSCGKFFEDRFLIDTANEISDRLDSFVFSKEPESSKLTYFELITAFSLLLFKNTGCDYAVLETGMGGRLDATNIVTPIASVLTPIELEHTEILGNTIPAIATEKSKIIKPAVPAFVSFQKPEAFEVFEKEALSTSSELYSIEKELAEFSSRTTDKGEITHIKFKDGFTADLTLSMLGKVQAQNCALSLLVLRKLRLYKKGITEEALEKTVIPARMERIFWKRPLFIDGAHTSKSIENLINTFRSLYPSKQGVCIFGCAKGKDFISMSDMLRRTFDKIIITKPGDFKKSDPQEIYDYMKSITQNTQQNPELETDAKIALEKALELSNENEPIVICGSFYLAGIIKDCLCR